MARDGGAGKVGKRCCCLGGNAYRTKANELDQLNAEIVEVQTERLADALSGQHERFSSYHVRETADTFRHGDRGVQKALPLCKAPL